MPDLDATSGRGINAEIHEDNARRCRHVNNKRSPTWTRRGSEQPHLLPSLTKRQCCYLAGAVDGTNERRRELGQQSGVTCSKVRRPEAKKM